METSTRKENTRQRQSQDTGKFRHRRVESTELNIEPYCKRPKLHTSELLPNEDERRRKNENKKTEETKSWKKDII